MPGYTNYEFTSSFIFKKKENYTHSSGSPVINGFHLAISTQNKHNQPSTSAGLFVTWQTMSCDDTV